MDGGGGVTSDFRFIEAEFNRLPNGINIDILFGGGMDGYIYLADKGVFESLKYRMIN